VVALNVGDGGPDTDELEALLSVRALIAEPERRRDDMVVGGTR
jgi:hypothetical protein